MEVRDTHTYNYIMLSCLWQHLDNHCLTGFVDGIATAWKEYDNDKFVYCSLSLIYLIYF